MGTVVTSVPGYQDVLSAARSKALASSFISPLLGTDIGQDSMFPDLNYNGGFNDGWIFFGVGDALAPQRSPANLGTSSVSMGMRSTWTSPNLTNSLRFRQLAFNIYSDPSRTPGSNGLITVRDQEDRCNRVGAAIISEFNDLGNQNQWWGDIYIVSCLLYSDLQIRDVPGEDGLVQGDIRFALMLG